MAPAAAHRGRTPRTVGCPRGPVRARPGPVEHPVGAGHSGHHQRVPPGPGQAWSSTARAERILLPGCQHWSKPDATGERHLTDCRNCFHYAMRYREEVMDALREAAARVAARADDGSLFDATAHP